MEARTSASEVSDVTSLRYQAGGHPILATGTQYTQCSMQLQVFKKLQRVKRHHHHPTGIQQRKAGETENLSDENGFPGINGIPSKN